MKEIEERPNWLKPQYSMGVLINTPDMEADMPAMDNTFAELLGAIGELIERNPHATSYVFTIVRKAPSSCT